MPDSAQKLTDLKPERALWGNRTQLGSTMQLREQVPASGNTAPWLKKPSRQVRPPAAAASSSWSVSLVLGSAVAAGLMLSEGAVDLCSGPRR